MVQGLVPQSRSPPDCATLGWPPHWHPALSGKKTTPSQGSARGSDVTFSDVEVLKGTAGAAALTLRFLGGPAPNGLTLAVSGMPRFAMNEQAVVFSTGNGVYACPLVGWWQGLYRVVLDDERNVLAVADHAWNSVVALDGVVGERDARVSSSPAVVALTLDEFKGLVAEELQ